jgi:hypothetical protein
MTQEEAIARIVAATNLTADDVLAILNCRDDEFEALVEAFESQKGVDAKTWAVVLAVLGIFGSLASVAAGVSRALRRARWPRLP